MSKLRVDQVETLDGLNTKNVATLVDDINTAQVTTSTGEQTLTEALNDRLNRSERYRFVDDLTGLKAISDMVNGQKASISFGGRAGDFIFDSSDKSANVSSDSQEGIYVAPSSDITGASGAWVRQYNILKPEFFGATGDGSVDDAPSVQSAINWIVSQEGGEILFSGDTYRCDSALTLSNNIPLSIKGTGANRPTFDFSVAAEGSQFFHVEGSERIEGLKIENIILTRSTKETKGSGGVGLSLKGVIRASVKRVFVENFDTCVEVNDIASGPASGCYFEELECSDPARYHLRIGGTIDCTFNACILSGFDGGHDQNCIMDESPNGRRPNATHFNNCMFIAAGGTKPTNNLQILSGFWNTFDNCVFERASGPNVRFQYGATPALSEISASFNSCWTNGTDSGAALLISGQGAHVYSRGCRWHTDVSPSTIGAVTIEPAAQTDLNCSFIGNSIRFNDGFGIWNRRGNNIIIEGNRVSGTGSDTGIRLEGNTANCIVLGNITYNVATSVGNTGTGNIVANNI